MVKLRGYQELIVNELRQGFRKYLRQVLCAPTGSGKTVMFSYIAYGAMKKGNKVCIITDRVELCQQTF